MHTEGLRQQSSGLKAQRPELFALLSPTMADERRTCPSASHTFCALGEVSAESLQAEAACMRGCSRAPRSRMAAASTDLTSRAVSRKRSRTLACQAVLQIGSPSSAHTADVVPTRWARVAVLWLRQSHALSP